MKRRASFVTSAAGPEGFPPEGPPEIAVVGRSNVGKSSLINALIGTDLARTSRTPGRTRLVNWFAIDAAPHQMMLVDLPGYGYAEVKKEMREGWRPLIEGYLAKRKSLAGVLLLVDMRRGVQDEELDFVPWLAAQGTPLVVALTKADKLAKHERAIATRAAKLALGLKRDPLAVSATKSDGLEAVWRGIVGLATARQGK